MHRYEATIEERVGPFKARFDWEISVTSSVPLERVAVVAKGKDTKLGAGARVEMTVQIERRDPSGTILDIQTELQVTGKVATLGQAVIKRKAEQVVRDFAGALEHRLQALEAEGERA